MIIGKKDFALGIMPILIEIYLTLLFIYRSYLETTEDIKISNIEGGNYVVEQLFIISNNAFKNNKNGIFINNNMLPRTEHKDFNVQMQIHQNKEIAQILYASNQDFDMKSVSLKPGFEYTIELSPFGQTSTKLFKELPIEKRKCLLENEIPKNFGSNGNNTDKEV